MPRNLKEIDVHEFGFRTNLPEAKKHVIIAESELTEKNTFLGLVI
jgi:hypothetical protein